MKTKKISNTSEILTYNEIYAELRETEYVIYQKLPIADVIDTSVKQFLTKKEKNFYEKSHFDFVITDKHHNPVFAIEFDGPYHQIKEEVRLRDVRKNRICQVAELPLLRITDLELEKVDSISIVRFIVYRFIKWTQNYDKIKNELENELANMSAEEYKMVVTDRFIDVGYNPDYIFHIEHPFPLKEGVITELKKQYQLEEKPSDSYWYSVNRYGSSFTNGFHSASYTYGIYKGKSPNSTISFKKGKLITEGIEVIKEEKINFVMKYALVTIENINSNTIPIQYKSTYGILPIYYSDIPGASIPDICEAIAEYVSYKKVLTWFQQNYDN
ncbi:MAG: DUF2726 domain-containing protein [Ignavibacterium sp.]|nr:DUF2726 domain-containing protein [Ignavibacterium sp.]